MNDINILCILWFCVYLTQAMWVCVRACYNTKWWNLWMNMKRLLTHSGFPDFHRHTMHTHTHWRLRVLRCMVCRRTIKQNPARWMMKTWKSFLCILYYTASLTVRHAFDSKMFRNVVNATWGSRKMMSTIELDVTAFDIRFSSKTQFVFGFLYNFNFVVCQMVWAVQI